MASDMQVIAPYVLIAAGLPHGVMALKVHEAANSRIPVADPRAVVQYDQYAAELASEYSPSRCLRRIWE